MNLKTFDTSTITHTKNSESTICFAKQGQITVSASLIRELDLKIGSKISIYQDEEDEINWFVAFNQPEGFTLRAKVEGINMNCNSSEITRKMYEAFSIDPETKSMRLKVLTDAPEKFGKITVYPLVRRN